jgi:hypothetical protein
VSSLWTPQECADYLRVSLKTLRRVNVPRLKLPSGRGERTLIRYQPEAVQRWAEGRTTERRVG